MTDLLYLWLALVLGAAILVFLSIRRRLRAIEALRWAKPKLLSSTDDLQRKRKLLLEREDRRPHDPTNLFLREHLKRRVERHNTVVEAYNETVETLK